MALKALRRQAQFTCTAQHGQAFPVTKYHKPLQRRRVMVLSIGKVNAHFFGNEYSMKPYQYMLAGLVLASLATFSATAGERDHQSRREASRPNPWHGEIHRFHEHDLNLWRSGRWHHGRHAGHVGWWWVVGGSWYFYPAAVYPYPDPYQPPVVVLPPTEPAPQYWYYCGNPAGYYPYVVQCLVGWQRVAANHPGPASPNSALPAPPPSPSPQLPQ